MQEYVIPPRFNFLEYDGRNEAVKNINPVAMYFFEFKHQLDLDDIVNIWQNLSPASIDEKMQTATATISHSLLINDFLQLRPQDNDPQNEIDILNKDVPPCPMNRTFENLQWIVFKVKQKAKTNYFEKTTSAKDPRFNFTLQIGQTEGSYSYNWPYDFFSLVELVKLDAVIEYESDTSVEGSTS